MSIPTIPPWLDWARREVGVQEIVGKRHNPRVVEYWSLGRVGLRVSDDETPWCAAFVAAALEQVGQRSTRMANARSYLDRARMTHLPGARLGSIAVLSSSRGPAAGHVGFVEAIDGNRVWLLGGNQSNAVNVAPFNGALVLAYVQPATWMFELPTAPNRPPASSRSGPVTDG
jgi:uncharacterized protein (TIGR02594 family)